MTQASTEGGKFLENIADWRMENAKKIAEKVNLPDDEVFESVLENFIRTIISNGNISVTTFLRALFIKQYRDYKKTPQDFVS